MSTSINMFLRAQASVPRTLPIACYIGFLALGPLISHLLPDPRWIYAIQIASVVILLGLFSKEYEELLHPPVTKTSEWPIAIGVGVLVFVFWINLEWPFLTLGESKGFDPRDASGAIDWPLAVTRIFGAAAVVPIMEELFWRSFILRWIDRTDFFNVDPRCISLKAMLMSSLVFGFEHSLWFAGILAGLAYAWLYRRSRNLWSPILAHATTNLLLGIWVLATANWRFW